MRPTDEMWHLGDVAMGKLELTLEVVRRLHGRKLLVPGNHDRCWPGHRKVGDWPQRYIDLGFTLLPVTTTLSLAGREALVCHFPYVGDSTEGVRYLEHRPRDGGRWLLHGHVHGAWRQRDRMINVGVDAWDYRPVALEEVEWHVGAGPRTVDRHGAPVSV